MPSSPSSSPAQSLTSFIIPLFVLPPSRAVQVLGQSPPTVIRRAYHDDDHRQVTNSTGFPVVSTQGPISLAGDVIPQMFLTFRGKDHVLFSLPFTSPLTLDKNSFQPLPAHVPPIQCHRQFHAHRRAERHHDHDHRELVYRCDHGHRHSSEPDDHARRHLHPRHVALTIRRGICDTCRCER